MDIRKKFFIVRVMRPWNMLPKEAVDSPGSMGVFEARLGEALTNLVCWKLCLHTTEGLAVDCFYPFFQPKPFHEFVTLWLV